MKILVTGAKGFVGKNLIATLNNIRTGKDKSFGLSEDLTIYEYDIDSNPALLDTLKKHGNNCPIMISSSIQAELDNPYGQSKKAGENLIFSYGEETGAPVYVY